MVNEQLRITSYNCKHLYDSGNKFYFNTLWVNIDGVQGMIQGMIMSTTEFLILAHDLFSCNN